MSVMYIPYALANIKFDTFKEIELSEFSRIERLSTRIAQHMREKYRPKIHVNGGLREKEKELREHSIVATQRYNILQQQVNEIKKANRKILEEGEYLRDMDSPAKLSWILTGRNRITELNKHERIYKSLYEQLSTLGQEMGKLEPYIAANINQTIERAIYSHKEHLESSESIQRDEWDKEYQIKLSQLRNELGYARSYCFLVRQLNVITNGIECQISCQRKYINGGNIFEDMKTNLINKTVQIIR